MSSSEVGQNLFRLSLPEWLKEQVTSGAHKGVFWIDEREKVFHVPWKHASRNGWEDGDVSLFKAWAIYTNRYKEGIDKPKPALWKTNFRCAINSHNYICFLKGQGERRGDTAHRIMKIMDQGDKILHENSKSDHVRKHVRMAHPSSSSGTFVKGKLHYANAKVEVEFCNCCENSTIDQCLKRRVIKRQREQVQSNFQSNNKTVNNFLLKSLNAGKTNVPTQKPSLQDLLYIGKALQSIDDLHHSYNATLPMPNTNHIVDKQKENVTSMHDCPPQSTPSHLEENLNCSTEQKCSIKLEDDCDDELITPRGC